MLIVKVDIEHYANNKSGNSSKSVNSDRCKNTIH